MVEPLRCHEPVKNVGTPREVWPFFRPSRTAHLPSMNRGAKPTPSCAAHLSPARQIAFTAAAASPRQKTDAKPTTGVLPPRPRSINKTCGGVAENLAQKTRLSPCDRSNRVRHHHVVRIPYNAARAAKLSNKVGSADWTGREPGRNRHINYDVWPCLRKQLSYGPKNHHFPERRHNQGCLLQV